MKRIAAVCSGNTSQQVFSSMFVVVFAVAFVLGWGGNNISLVYGDGTVTDGTVKESSPALSSDDLPTDEEKSEEEKPAEENPAQTATKIVGEIANAVQENSAEDLLNLATEAKLSAESVLDLTKTIAYCIEAEKKGLDDDSLDYCHKLKLATQLERGLALANLFMNDDLSVSDLPHGWETIRSMALEDLRESLDENPELLLARLAVGRLEMLPDGDTDQAAKDLDLAITAADGSEPDILAEALKYRSILTTDPQEGIKLLQRALELSKDNPTLMSLLATKFSEINQDEKALDLLDEALRLDPDNNNFKKAKAFALAALSRPEEAEQLFDEAIEGDRSPLTAVEKAQFLASIHQVDRAIDQITDVIGQMDRVPVLYFLRSQLYLQEKDYRQAMKDVNQALRIDPSFSDAIQLKGVIYLRQMKTAEAVRIFEVLLSRSPDDVDVITQVAYARAQNNDYRGAIKLLTDASEKNPDSFDILRCQGDIELMYGQFAAATAVYEKILAGKTDDSGALNNYAWLLSTAPDDSVRNGEKALELALRAADLTNYRESHILSTLGAAYAETGDFDKAIEWSEKAVELGEKQKFDRLEDLKKEPQSYRNHQPWRETPEKANVPIDSVPADESSAAGSTDNSSASEPSPAQEDNANAEEFF